MKNLSYLILFFTLLSCNKEKPEAGMYFAVFTYNNPPSLVKSANVKVDSPDKNSIIIANNLCNKNGKNITAENIYIPGIGSYLSLNGKWKKKSGHYLIAGTFNQIDYQGGNQYEYNGSFEIKSLN